MKQEETSSSSIPRQRSRIDSIDIIRGLTMLVMIFVNDVATVTGTPPWMHHMPSEADGMTFVDLVFPSFLFIVGMSVPFAIGRRLNKEAAFPVVKHVLIRSFSLILIGVYMVNGETISSAGIIDPHLWSFLLFVSVLVLWSKSDNFRFMTNKYTKAAALAVFIVLFFIYRGNNATSLIQMRPQWWGILGLIGWSYIISVLLYIPLRNNRPALIGCIAVLYSFYIAARAGMGSSNIIVSHLEGVSSLAAIVMSGILLGTIIDEFSKEHNHKKIIKWSAGYVIFLVLTGFFLHQLNYIHPMFIISKDYATVPWCLYSSAITVFVWIIIYRLTDVAGQGKYFSFLQHAGKNALLVYVLPAILINLIILISMVSGLPNFYDIWGENFAAGFFRSLLLAVALTWVGGLLSKKKLHLKL